MNLKIKRKRPGFVAIIGAVFVSSLASIRILSAQSSFSVTVCYTSPGKTNPSIVPCFGVFELTFVHPNDYGANKNFIDVDIQVTFIEPVSGRKTTVGGFYYDTLSKGQSLWKARFVPSKVGIWAFSYTFTHIASGRKATGTGSFESIPSANPGFLRLNRLNPFRWEFDNGQPFVPIGFNDCLAVNALATFDGGDKNGAFLGATRTDEYLKAYADAGFNVLRFSQDNCSPRLIDASFNNYDKDTAMFFDWFMEQLRNYHFRIFYGLLGYVLPDNPATPPPSELFKFINYSINRWGSYVDIWELQNERNASDVWITTVASYLRSHDPYKHPITTSYQRPDLNVIEINTPHTYIWESASQSDWRIAGDADTLKRKFSKPVIFGEIGNTPPEGKKYGNWLPESALRMRIMGWTAFFKEIGLIFWNTSWATNGSGPNIYLGHEERQYTHILQWFANLVIRPDSRPLDVASSDSSLMRAYALTSSDGIAVYIHHNADHTNVLEGKTMTVDIPWGGRGFWLDPATGVKLGTLEVSAGRNTLDIPDFMVDIAFFSTSVSSFKAPPVATVAIGNAQADGDLDDDGSMDYEPSNLPFGIAPLTLRFRAGVASDLDGGALSYLWHFGDGSPDQSQAEVTHTYAPGNYFTSLTVTDDEGNTASHSFIVRAAGDSKSKNNIPPLLNKLRDLTVREGQLIIITPWATDRELGASGYINDNLEYKMKGLPRGASFGRRGADWSKQFWWVPDFSQSGTYKLEFTVLDEHGKAGVPQNVTITVLAASCQQ